MEYNLIKDRKMISQKTQNFNSKNKETRKNSSKNHSSEQNNNSNFSFRKKYSPESLSPDNEKINDSKKNFEKKEMKNGREVKKDISIQKIIQKKYLKEVLQEKLFEQKKIRKASQQEIEHHFKKIRKNDKNLTLNKANSNLREKLLINEIKNIEKEEQEVYERLKNEIQKNRAKLIKNGKSNIKDLRDVKKKCNRNLFKLENRVLTPCTDFYINKKNLELRNSQKKGIGKTKIIFQFKVVGFLT